MSARLGIGCGLMCLALLSVSVCSALKRGVYFPPDKRAGVYFPATREEEGLLLPYQLFHLATLAQREWEGTPLRALFLTKRDADDRTLECEELFDGLEEGLEEILERTGETETRLLHILHLVLNQPLALLHTCLRRTRPFP